MTQVHVKEKLLINLYTNTNSYDMSDLQKMFTLHGLSCNARNGSG